MHVDGVNRELGRSIQVTDALQLGATSSHISCSSLTGAASPKSRLARCVIRGPKAWSVRAAPPQSFSRKAPCLGPKQAASGDTALNGEPDLGWSAGWRSLDMSTTTHSHEQLNFCVALDARNSSFYCAKPTGIDKLTARGHLVAWPTRNQAGSAAPVPHHQNWLWSDSDHGFRRRLASSGHSS
jgi:hypothetical protein